MSNVIYTTNVVKLTGEIVSELTFSHEIYGEKFFEVTLSVKRLSSQFDLLPITISERLMPEVSSFALGNVIGVEGQFRSYNKLVDGKSKLMLTVFVRQLLPYLDFDNPNVIELSGFICKEPIFRTTPFNREICDILLAVNRAYNKSDYIPCIAWGRNARFVRHLSVGEQTIVYGRIQSRNYQKKLSEDNIVSKVAYEVSISRILTGEYAKDELTRLENIDDIINLDVMSAVAASVTEGAQIEL